MDRREVLREVKSLVVAQDKSVDGNNVPPSKVIDTSGVMVSRPMHNGDSDVRDEAQVRDGELVAEEPLLLGEHAFEDAEHAQGLLLVPFDRAGDLLRMGADEPNGLAEVGPDSRVSPTSWSGCGETRHTLVRTPGTGAIAAA